MSLEPFLQNSDYFSPILPFKKNDTCYCFESLFRCYFGTKRTTWVALLFIVLQGNLNWVWKVKLDISGDEIRAVIYDICVHEKGGRRSKGMLIYTATNRMEMEKGWVAGMMWSQVYVIDYIRTGSVVTCYIFSDELSSLTTILGYTFFGELIMFLAG